MEVEKIIVVNLCNFVLSNGIFCEIFTANV